MAHLRLALLGFGNVGRAFAALLQRKSGILSERYDLTWQINGVATRRLGWLADAHGLDVETLLIAPDKLPHLPSDTDVSTWLAASQADVLFEITLLNPTTGQPAIDHLRTALASGLHAITANKGPLVHAYAELRELANRQHKKFYFESTVLDSVPIFSLFRTTLPATDLLSFHGLFNSTTSVILAAIEDGLSMEEGIAHAQRLGITESDPSADIDGWDAAVKVCALANVLMDIPLRPANIHIQGIRELSAEQIRQAKQTGHPYRLISRARRAGNSIIGSVQPEQLMPSDPMVGLPPTSLSVTLVTDIFDGLTLTENAPTPTTTAYGLLADFINAVTAHQ